MIRTVEIEDAAALLEMQCQLDKQTKHMMFEEDERPRDVEQLKDELALLKQQGSLMLVVEEGEKIVGFLSAERGQYRRINHCAYIVIGILECYRGKGIGKALFSKLNEWAMQNQITRLELTVMCHNTQGIALYKKNGFEIEGVKKHSMRVNGSYVDEYYMAKVFE